MLTILCANRQRPSPPASLRRLQGVRYRSRARRGCSCQLHPVQVRCYQAQLSSGMVADFTNTKKVKQNKNIIMTGRMDSDRSRVRCYFYLVSTEKGTKPGGGLYLTSMISHMRAMNLMKTNLYLAVFACLFFSKERKSPKKRVERSRSRIEQGMQSNWKGVNPINA